MDIYCFDNNSNTIKLLPLEQKINYCTFCLKKLAYETEEDLNIIIILFSKKLSEFFMCHFDCFNQKKSLLISL